MENEKIVPLPVPVVAIGDVNGRQLQSNPTHCPLMDTSIYFPMIDISYYRFSAKPEPLPNQHAQMTLISVITPDDSLHFRTEKNKEKSQEKSKMEKTEGGGNYNGGLN